MAGIFATAGSRIYIGQTMTAQATDFVESDFNVNSWTEINWVESIGSFGDEATEITFDAINQSRTMKLKGTRNAGNLELVMGDDSDDAGQAALRAAETTPYDYAFRIDFNDQQLGGQPSKRYFIAKVMSAREQLDGANNVVKLNCTLGINSNIVQVAANP